MTRATSMFIFAPLVLLVALGVMFYALERSSNARVRRLGALLVVLTGMIVAVIALLPHAKLAGLSRLEILLQIALAPAAAAGLFLLEAVWLARVLAKRLGDRFVLFLVAYVALGGLLWAITAWIGVLAMMFIGF